MTHDTTSPERVAYTPAEFAEAIGARVKTVRQHIANGEIRAEKLGNRFYIPASEVARIFGDKDAA
jgi:excisionase family DNA binding protein